MSFYYQPYVILQMKALLLALEELQELIGFLEFERKVTLNWFNENRMIVIPGKSQAGHNYRSEKI